MIGRLAQAQYRSTQWTADSGLPQNSVRGMVQTPDGYIWVATFNGVARFDGVRFTVFDKSNTPGISSSRFIAMVAGTGGDLWLPSEDNNVVRFHEGRFETLGESSGIRPKSVSAITSDGHGGVWVSSDEKVYRWTPGSGRFEKETFNSDATPFNPLWWVGTGFWTIRDGSLLCFVRGHLKSYSLPKSVTRASIRGITAGSDESVWIGLTDGRLGRLVNGKLLVETVPITTDFISSPRTDWKVQISQNFARTLTFPSGGVDKGIPYNVIMDDNEGNTWVGSEGDGLFRIQKQSIQSLSTAQGLASDNVYPVMKSHSGDMWVGSWPAGLSLVRDGKVTTFTQKDGLPGLVSALAEDRAGRMWIGTHNGLRIYSGGRLQEPPGMPNEKMPAVQAMHSMAGGAMLLGTPKGLYVLDGARSHWMTTREGLATDDVRVIIEDRRGDTWIAGYGGLTRVHDGALTRWTEAQGLPSNNIRSIVEDRSGDIWIGTYDGGIGWLRNGKWITFNESLGLFDNGAFQILEDTQERFWISSNRGIYRVSRAQLKEVADGRERRVASIAYGRADGMLSVECNGGLWPAGAADAHGNLWFPTQKGVAIVDPASVSIMRQPPGIAIESASVEHKLQDGISRVVMQPGQTNLEVQYTAFSYSKPEQVSFRYKLDGVDADWQEVGQRRTAYYSHLPPGDYMFRVSASNSDSVASLADGMLEVDVIPPFYRRWWFILLIFLAVASAIRLLWQYRVNQLRNAQAAQQNFSRELISSQENERRRIAAELHDSLGQRLIIINNLALFLLRTKGRVRTEEDKLMTLEEISTEAIQAIEETRAISYALRPFQLDRLGLSKAVQALAKTVANASEIELTAEIADIDEVFPEDLRINFFRIVQEALNNMVKHSEASRGLIKVQRAKSSVVLTISDNGKGLPNEPRSQTSGPGGFGLIGIRERATLLNGTLQIRSEPEAGTLLVVEFSLGSERVQ